MSYELEQIQRWLSKTRKRSLEDWDWDGETLTVYAWVDTENAEKELRTERYSRADLIEVGAININI